MSDLEKVAACIYHKRNGAGCTPWSRLTRTHQEPYLGDARAAVEALREPSSEMLFQGVLAQESDDPAVQGIWYAMVDAILKEG